MTKIESDSLNIEKELLVKNGETDKKYAGEWIQSIYKQEDYITFGYFKDEIRGLYQAGRVPIESLNQNLSIYGQDEDTRNYLINTILLQLIYNDKKCIHIGKNDALISKIPKNRIDDLIKINSEKQLKNINKLSISNNPIVLIDTHDINYDFLFNEGMKNMLSYTNINTYISITDADKYMSENQSYLTKQIFKNDYNFIISSFVPSNYPTSVQNKLNDIKHHLSFNPGGNPNDGSYCAKLIGETNAWELGDLSDDMFMGRFIVGENHLTNAVPMNILPEMKPIR